ncbi:MAG: polymer-forming cytoskeletal protein [Gemmatimonadaceae bacterium]|nr:polymer-forming cytoskeletal protein [Gemmatimonadaceae bacterium]
MRRVLMAAVALLAIGGPARAHAQQTAVPPSTAARDSLAPILDSVRATPAGRALPSLDRFTWGNLSIPAGATVDGPVAAARGNVDVRGLVHGDVFAVGGDVVVHTGGEVTGSALAFQGKVIVDGGRVGGEIRAASPLGIAAAEAEPRLTGSAAVMHALKISAGWLVVVLLVGLGVIVFSGAQLEAVVQALENRFSTAFVIGVAAQVGAVPLLALLCLALALTVVGILLIPFAVVAYILGVAGLITLGALAAASVAGHAVIREGRNVRVRAMRSMVTGTVLLMLPWLASALLVNSQWGGMLARIVAVAITWVAASAGLGAALMARGGVRRVYVHVGRATASPEAWQTPTPIGGIVAARRPTPTPTPSSPNGAAH